VARHVAPSDARRVADFLGEVCAIPTVEDASPQLRAARGDAIVMGDQVRRAFEDFVVAEAIAHPLAIVLDDLHWGDRASVSFVDAALRQANERRLLVVAFARPEIEDVFPRLWTERGLHHVRLAPLTKKASEKLVREVLGADVDASVLARIVEGASGNAFYLEELMRAHVEGRSDAMPETVLAMVEARLATMEPEARRVLRAASVFGDVFWTGGVHALVGGGLRGDRSSLAEAPLKTATEEWIDELGRRELLVMHRSSRVSGEREGGFRHALVREAAYAMLTDRDRALGHRLAGEWLESMDAGPQNADALAEHFVRGAEPSRAVVHLRRAAGTALEGNDFVGAIARADKAIQCGAEGQVLGELRLVQAESHHWRGAQAEKETCAVEAMQLLPRGSAAWARAVGMAITAHRRLRKHDALIALAEDVGKSLSDPDSPPGVIVAAAQVATQLLPIDPERGAAFFTELRAAFRPDRDGAARAWLAAAAAIDALQRHDPVEQLERAREAREAFSDAGDLRNVAIQAINVSHACFNLGAVEEGEAVARDGLAVADRLGLRSVRPFLAGNLASLLIARGAKDEAYRLYEQAIAEGEAERNVQIAAVMRTHLAHYLACDASHAALDRVDAVGKPVFDAVDGVAPGEAVMARAVLAEIDLARGRVDEALAHARLAVAHAGPDHAGHLEPLPYAVLCDVLRARGERDEALRVIDRARDDLHARAATIRAPYSASFLARVPDHARVLHLAAVLHASEQ
jgi:tetratricopeptide (TPR) repeat protein